MSQWIEEFFCANFPIHPVLLGIADGVPVNTAGGGTVPEQGEHTGAWVSLR